VRHAKGRDRGSHIASIILTLALTLTTVRACLAHSSAVQTTLESAVRIEVTLEWPNEQRAAEFSGSGWTRACIPSADGFDVVIATAGHVIDVEALNAEARPSPHSTTPRVKVVVLYRDGRQYTAGRENLRVDGRHDYGEIRLSSSVSRTVLPAGQAAAVQPGTRLYTIASPGLLTFAY
jgi:hypothetical protein